MRFCQQRKRVSNPWKRGKKYQQQFENNVNWIGYFFVFPVQFCVVFCLLVTFTYTINVGIFLRKSSPELICEMLTIATLRMLSCLCRTRWFPNKLRICFAQYNVFYFHKFYFNRQIVQKYHKTFMRHAFIEDQVEFLNNLNC